MTHARSTVIGIEVLVPELSPAVETLTRGFGCELAWSGPSEGVDADVAVLDAGAITITLICPTHTGRPAIPDRQPRLTQLVFGVEGSDVGTMVDGLRALGLAVEDRDGARPYIPPAVAEGVLGFKTALVVSPHVADATDEALGDAVGDGEG